MCVVNCVFANAVKKFLLDHRPEDDQDSTPAWLYALAALTYEVASVSGQKALAWISYPTQVIGKSCKPIPIMIFGVLFCQIRYPVLKYFFVSLIGVGVALFMYKDEAETDLARPEVWSNLGVGELLLLLSLCFDGITGAVQERMKLDHSPKSTDMMAEINKWAALYLAVLVVGTQEIWQLSAFIQRHPEIIWQLLSITLTGSCGQFFIFMCITEVGPLQCSIITTTRKLLTVFCSVLLYGNAVSNRQWLGAGFVFVGLYLDLYFGKVPKIDDGHDKASSKTKEECNLKKIVVWCC
jgi:UDP-galactose transporter B1